MNTRQQKYVNSCLLSAVAMPPLSCHRQCTNGAGMEKNRTIQV